MTPDRRIATQDDAGRTCPYCRFPIKEGGDIALCGDCQSAHHFDCWNDNGGCAVVACAGGLRGPSSDEQTTQAMPPPMPAVEPVPTISLGKTDAAWPRAQVPQQPAPPPPVAPQPHKSRAPGIPMALFILALAVGGVATALIIAKSHSNKATTVTQALGHPGTTHSAASSTSTPSTPVVTRTVTTPVRTTTPRSAPPQGLTPPPVGGGGNAPSNGPDDALRHYWQLMANGSYQRAYNMESARLQGDYSSFVNDKQTAQPMINVVSIGSPSSASGDADVPIQFYAQDRFPSNGSDTTCRYFDMTAHMVQNSDGSWSYDGPVSGTDNVTAMPGSPDCHT